MLNPPVPAATQTSGKRTYFPELDGVRAVAVTMVMLFHSNGPILHLPGPITLGQTGVDLFFVLSGFLISGILLKANQRDWHEVRVFYTRRSLRIFPLYYATLILVWTFLMHDHVSWDVWIYLQNITMTLGMWMRGPMHFWSLAVEEQFYLVWPFLVLWLPRRHLGKVLATMIVAALLSRVVLIHYGLGTFYLTPSRMDSLAAGAIVALVHYRGSLERLRPVFAMTFFASVTVLAAEQVVIATHGSSAYAVVLTKLSVLAAMYASGIGLLLLQVSPRLNRVLASSPLRFAGRISYGLYVFHPFVYLWIERHMSHASTLERALTGFGGTYAVALISWYLFERYFIALKDRLAPERTQFAANSPAIASF